MAGAIGDLYVSIKSDVSEALQGIRQFREESRRTAEESEKLLRSSNRERLDLERAISETSGTTEDQTRGTRLELSAMIPLLSAIGAAAAGVAKSFSEAVFNARALKDAAADVGVERSQETAASAAERRGTALGFFGGRVAALNQEIAKRTQQRFNALNASLASEAKSLAGGGNTFTALLRFATGASYEDLTPTEQEALSNLAAGAAPRSRFAFREPLAELQSRVDRSPSAAARRRDIFEQARIEREIGLRQIQEDLVPELGQARELTRIMQSQANDIRFIANSSSVTPLGSSPRR